MNATKATLLLCVISEASDRQNQMDGDVAAAVAVAVTAISVCLKNPCWIKSRIKLSLFFFEKKNVFMLRT